MKKLYWLALPLFMGTATSFLKADEINNLAAALKDIIISSAPLSDLDWKLKTALNNEKFEKLLNQIETKKEESNLSNAWKMLKDNIVAYQLFKKNPRTYGKGYEAAKDPVQTQNRLKEFQKKLRNSANSPSDAAHYMLTLKYLDPSSFDLKNEDNRYQANYLVAMWGKDKNNKKKLEPFNNFYSALKSLDAGTGDQTENDAYIKTIRENTDDPLTIKRANAQYEMLKNKTLQEKQEQEKKDLEEFDKEKNAIQKIVDDAVKEMGNVKTWKAIEKEDSKKRVSDIRSNSIKKLGLWTSSKNSLIKKASNAAAETIKKAEDARRLAIDQELLDETNRWKLMRDKAIQEILDTTKPDQTKGIPLTAVQDAAKEFSNALTTNFNLAQSDLTSIKDKKITKTWITIDNDAKTNANNIFQEFSENPNLFKLKKLADAAFIISKLIVAIDPMLLIPVKKFITDILHKSPNDVSQFEAEVKQLTKQRLNALILLMANWATISSGIKKTLPQYVKPQESFKKSFTEEAKAFLDTLHETGELKGETTLEIKQGLKPLPPTKK
ncbi:TPA: hypothetical protein DDZ86_04450 [Candidatus Dependentiae bacterium]|nr:MAG: hypothetical protein UW09_C0002G0121 [candidate division TM6 bacterium GW2011_GWF2_43_87]HBL98863.1 hypothetical protein [Candidatus Dependentiae bacterium]